ncbi:MAG: type IV toxin-antitoxin system AbiEi family antitoxin domain-containing protein [Slackia sp.]
MSKYEDIYEAAADNYGLVTRDEAVAMGVSDKELSRLTSDGKLTRIGHGVYRVKHHVPSPFDPFAESVAAVGLTPSLASPCSRCSLCPTNPTKMFVATPKRVRRKLPEGMKVMQRGTIGCDATGHSFQRWSRHPAHHRKAHAREASRGGRRGASAGAFEEEEADRVDSEVGS